MLDFNLGPFLIQGSYIILLLSLTFSLLITYGLLSHYKLNDKKVILSEWVQSILMIIIIWKFSYILSHPIEGIQDPLRLIYFDGGAVGWIVGVLVAYIFYRKALTKQSIPSEFIQNTFIFSGLILFGAFQVLYIWMYSLYWGDIVFGVYFITLAIFFFFSNRFKSNKSSIRIGQWAVAGWIGHDIINGNIHMNDWTLWGAFLLGITLLVLDFRLIKGSEHNA
ncbi:hypothetical protein [Pontibacillus sp. HMF3514]|uniref:hypothetical protein n=1 Tax=Pontibacillus sp. HMF3514 TaxID=2692425 RepID=UPI00131F58DB|nr:hypothetical protein [Pontibacillus sp. HMF3514]QHE52307.1 hypothetical protein GS400_09790 [Pontibacillus sp. HMF3514]